MIAVETKSHPVDSLLEAVVSFLAPLLTAGCSGDPVRARLAALDIVASYRARSQSELMKVMQIVGFGLMAMDNLRLSVAPDLPLSKVLQLRSGATALGRSAQQISRALERHEDKPPVAAEPMAPLPAYDAPEITETDIHTSIERARALIATARSSMQDEPPAETTAQPSAASPPGAATRAAGTALPVTRQTAAKAEQQRKLLWADAMAEVANELAAQPDAESLSNRLWAEALNSSASSLAIAATSAPQDQNIGFERTGKWSKST